MSKRTYPTTVGKLRRNPFYKEAQEILEHYGFKHYCADNHSHGQFKIIVHCQNADGKELQRFYPFPAKIGAFSAIDNFRSQFRRFIHTDIMEKGLFPLRDEEDRTRRSGMQAFKLPQNKPPEPPSAEVVQLVQASPPVPIPPAKRQSLNERIKALAPDEMVRVSYLMKASDVVTVTDTLRGTATIITFKVHEPVEMRAAQ